MGLGKVQDWANFRIVGCGEARILKPASKGKPSFENVSLIDLLF